jgi:arylsulfatase A-like enzyme
MSDSSRPFARWPVPAAAATLHGISLLAGLAVVLDLGRTAPGRWLPVAGGLLVLAAVEGAAALLLDAALGAAARRLPAWGALVLDGAEALALAALVALPAASLAKLAATGAHLRRSDLWFATANLRQLLGEAQPREVAALLALPAAMALLAALFFAALRLCRRRPFAARPAAVVLGSGALAAALLLAWSRVPALATLAREVAPEVHWLARSAWAPAAHRATAPAEPSVADLPPIVPYAPGEAPRPWNVVVVMLESVSWPLIDRRPEAAPNLVRLRSESVAFERVYSPSTHSDYAQMAALSSLHPRKFARHDFYVELHYPRTLLWDALSAAGYATAMFSCQNERWGNMLRYLDTPGLEVLRHAPDWPRAPRHGTGAESKVFEETPVGEWQRWLARAREPFFTYLNFQATHFPYQVPPGARQPFSPFALDFPATFVAYPRDRVPVMENRFFNALAYSDAWLGEVDRALEASGLRERTLLVVLADHGEAFYEHEEPTHGSSLHEEQVRALLLVRSPGREPRSVSEPVSLLDVAPAILRELGLPPHGNFQGRGDVLDPGYRAGDRPFLFTLQGLVERDGLLVGDWKLVLDRDRGERRLYTLASDPEERRHLAASEPERAAALEALLAELLERQLTYYDLELWRQGLYPPPLP